MKHTFLLVLQVLIASFLSAQDLHIHYDVRTEKVRYIIDGQEVSQPKVRRGSQVHFHIDNYNNYLYNVVIQAENREVSLPGLTGQPGLTNLFPTLGGGVNPLTSMTTGRGAPQSFEVFAQPGVPREYNVNYGISNSQFNKLTKDISSFYSTFEKIKVVDSVIQAQQREVQNITEAYQIRSFVLQEVTSIKYDPNLKTDRIRQLASDYLEKVLDARTPDQVNLNVLLEKSNTRAQLLGKLDEIKNQHRVYDQELQVIEKLMPDVERYRDNLLLSEFIQPLFPIYAEASSRSNTYRSIEGNISDLVSEIPDIDMLKLNAIWREYVALADNPFSMPYRTSAKGDEISFSVRLVPNDTGLTRGLQPLQKAPIEVPVFGGFKVNASIGVAFGQFFNRPQSYFVRDSIIRAEDEDGFYPVVASFFHFYNQTAKNLSLGGSFGIGFPVAGSGSASQSASFFFGPSFIIGREQRIVLNGGIMGGRVQRLAQAFEVGDRFISQANTVPVKPVYELGYFMGVSFNVLSR